MASQISPVDSATHTAARLGYYLAIITSLLTLGTFITAFLTPPLSGPSCIADTCYEYPYLDIASRFPRDYWWMIPATVLALVFVALIACIPHVAPPEKKVFSQIGLAFAIIAAAALVIVYWTQLVVIQPSVEAGEADGISLLSQYNAHGLFIALEEVGYSLIALTFLAIAPVFAGMNRVERVLRWLFGIGFVLALVALVGTSIIYGIEREYRFEIMIISIDWIVMIITGFLLSIVFKRAIQTA